MLANFGFGSSKSLRLLRLRNNDFNILKKYKSSLKMCLFQFWKAKEGDFDEQTTDDWDVDMSVYYEKDTVHDKVNLGFCS
jgi:hypothetical protein